MKYLLTFCPAVGIIAYHGAWRSIECPLLLSLAVLICIIIKTQKDEQGKKKRAQ